MQAGNKFYNAHETSAVEDFAIAIGCGEADFKMYAGVIAIDGARVRYRMDDWRKMLVVKALRAQLKGIMNAKFRDPRRELSEVQMKWMELWRRSFEMVAEGRK